MEVGIIPQIRILTISVEFEIVGQIQGSLYYLYQCKEKCDKLGLHGWAKSTTRGTIVGKIQGPKLKIQEMISWFSISGSPGIRIDNCYLYNYQYLPRPDFRGFKLRI